MNKFLCLALIVALVQCITGAPQQISTPVPILSQDQQDDGLGNFRYNFETGDGIKQEANGALKDIQVPTFAADGTVIGQEVAKGEVQQGQYSYQAPDGSVITLKWIADENGFQPQGDHLPVA